MWKCPFCETINDEDSCAVCGELRPMPPAKTESNNNNQSANSPETVSTIPPYMGVHTGDASLEPTPTLGNSPQKPNKKTWMWIVAIIVLLAIIGGFIAVIIAEKRSVSSAESTENIEVGSYITFGKYEQDNNAANGAEDIEWLVLAKADDRALVISKYALDCQPYNERSSAITWEECTLRAWLNDEFYNSAFSESEKTRIPTTVVFNEDNSTYGTYGGKDTHDKVFLLSIDEANEYFASDSERECEPTPYAVENGVLKSASVNCCWWLRSPGSSQDSATEVIGVGCIFNGTNVSFTFFAVRPAMWITLD